MQFVTAPPEYCHQDSDAVHHCSYWNIVVVQQCLCDHTYRLTCTPAHHTTTQHNYTCHSTTWKTLLHTLLHDTAPTHAHMHTHTHTHVRIHTSQPYKYLSRENTHTHAATSHSMHAHTHTHHTTPPPHTHTHTHHSRTNSSAWKGLKIFTLVFHSTLNNSLLLG